MDPLSALSLASAVIQIADFSTKVLSRTKEIYTSTDDTFQNAKSLEAATANISELLVELEDKTSVNHRRSGRQTADKQLVRLAHDSIDIANTLRTTLDGLRHKKDDGKRNAFDQGLRSVLQQEKIVEIADRLDAIRKQVDTAILFSLR